MGQTPRTLLLAGAIALAIAATGCAKKPAVEPIGRTGIEGKVTIGPQCPVQRADSPCPDSPYEARIQVRDSSGKVVVTFISNADGTFRIDVAPGRYTLVPQSGMPLPHAEPVDVTVVEGRYTRVDIAYDSGIR